MTGDDFVGIIDEKDFSEVFRRLGGFLALVGGALRPLLQTLEQEQEAARALKRAEFVIGRVVDHLNCHSSYYNEVYLRYVADLTQMRTIQDFVREVVEERLTVDEDAKQLIRQLFKEDDAYLNGHDIERLGWNVRLHMAQARGAMRGRPIGRP
jgi:hypothetical protein